MDYFLVISTIFGLAVGVAILFYWFYVSKEKRIKIKNIGGKPHNVAEVMETIKTLNTADLVYMSEATCQLHGEAWHVTVRNENMGCSICVSCVCDLVLAKELQEKL